MSSFLAIETALTALRSNQLGLEVSAHNIANVNNPDYSRQVVKLTAALPVNTPALTGGLMAGIGTGVTVDSISRMFDSFSFRALQDSQNQQGMYGASADTLQNIEKIFNEPSDAGIASSIGGFFNSLQQLSSNPEDGATRSLVTQQAAYLADTLRGTTQNLTKAQQQLDAEVASVANDINNLTTRIADLNQQTVAMKVSGAAPNDFMDQRDALVQQLSRLTDIQTNEDPSGALFVYSSGQPLVMGPNARSVTVQRDAHGMNQVVFADRGMALTTNGGKLKALLNDRDKTIPGYVNSLNSIASSLITSINTQHRAGVGLDGTTGLDLFTGTNAEDIQVATAVAQDPNKLAASSSGAAGDGSNAQAMAQVRDAQLLSGGTSTLEESYASLVNALGVQSQNAQKIKGNFDNIVQQYQNRRDSVSSVSLDEEMVNILRFQQGYAAAAKVIISADEVTQDLFNILR